MDIVLEVTDTFIGDYLWSFFLPARPAPQDYADAVYANSSAKSFSSWTYEPSTHLFSLEPSQYAYMSSFPRDDPLRQLTSLYFITWWFGLILYFIFSSLSYQFIFDKRTVHHPKYIKNQVWLEIVQANKSMPVMSILFAPLFTLEVRGYSKLYDSSSEGPGLWWDILQFPAFLLFTDFCIYWIHRYLHHPRIYKHLHKAHHKWIMPTPFASYAFHPIDGFCQGLPYHIFPFIFPMQKLASVVFFVFVNFWTILIHDGEYLSNNPIVNGAACHSLHHSRFEVNYGQFFTAFDRLGGTYRLPEDWMFEKEKMSMKKWQAEAKTVENLIKEVEGSDDRIYDDETKKTN
ncbi:fatty acid hydroxylase superfamily protein [Sarocladium implicatum]|nr:fatty acid hydroxylase superfamily protein [Sarocladium implicatum]